MKLDIKLSRLMETLKTLGPVVGLDGTAGNVTEVRYNPPPTIQQQTAVNAAIATFDWTDAADDSWFANLNPERKTLRDQADAAITRLDQIINAADPPMANLSQVVTALQNQILPAIRDMARYERAIIRRVIQIE